MNWNEYDQNASECTREDTYLQVSSFEGFLAQWFKTLFKAYL